MGQAPEVLIFGLNHPPEPAGIALCAGALATGLTKRGYRVPFYVAHTYYPEWKIREGYGGWSSAEHRDGVEVHRLRHYMPRNPKQSNGCCPS